MYWRRSRICRRIWGSLVSELSLHDRESADHVCAGAVGVCPGSARLESGSLNDSAQEILADRESPSARRACIYTHVTDPHFRSTVRRWRASRLKNCVPLLVSRRLLWGDVSTVFYRFIHHDTSCAVDMITPVPLRILGAQARCGALIPPGFQNLSAVTTVQGNIRRPRTVAPETSVV